MMLETVHRLHPESACVRVVLNMAVNDELPFAVDGVKVTEVPHDRWDHEEDARRGARLLIGVHRPPVKRAVFDFFDREFGIDTDRYVNLVHPAAELAATTRLGHGAYIGPRVVIGPYASIGNVVTLNRAATVGHHTTVGDFVTVNPGANIAGRCRLGDGVAIGIGATVMHGVEIGQGSVIGAGSVVTRDLPEGVIAYGAPARIVRSVE